MRASRRCYAPALRTEARYPGLAAGAGHYESFFLRANRPSGGESVWIRYTIDRPPGADATASLWLTWFDAASPAPLAAKASFPPRLVFPPGGYIAIGEASLTPGHATGSIAREGGELGWDLNSTTARTPSTTCRADGCIRGRSRGPRSARRTRARGSRASCASGIEPSTSMAGPGMVGHNWGSEHAERWVWIDATGIDGGTGFLDLVAGRVRVAGRLLPWIANGVIEFEGKRHRLGGFSRDPVVPSAGGRDRRHVQGGRRRDRGPRARRGAGARRSRPGATTIRRVVPTRSATAASRISR